MSPRQRTRPKAKEATRETRPDLNADNGERFLDELPDRVRLASGQHKVVRLILLEHAPHTLDIVLVKAKKMSSVRQD